MDAKSIIANLERLRELNGLKKSEVAKAVGITRNTYLNLISGNTKVINENLPSLARLYKISLEELLLGYKPINREEQMLRESAQHEEKRRALIDDYEQKLSTARDKIDNLNEIIDVQRRNIRALEALNSIQSRHLEEK